MHVRAFFVAAALSVCFSVSGMPNAVNTCEYCGHSLYEKAKFCTNCGRKRPSPQNATSRENPVSFPPHVNSTENDSARIAVESYGWCPFRISVCGPVGLPVGMDWDVLGCDFGCLWNVSVNVVGLQLCSGVNQAHSVSGGQVGLYNHATELHGIQVGGFNYAAKASGLQIGVVNCAKDAQPLLQIGALNWIMSNRTSFLPILNAYF